MVYSTLTSLPSLCNRLWLHASSFSFLIYIFLPIVNGIPSHSGLKSKVYFLCPLIFDCCVNFYSFCQFTFFVNCQWKSPLFIDNLMTFFTLTSILFFQQSFPVWISTFFVIFFTFRCQLSMYFLKTQWLTLVKLSPCLAKQSRPSFAGDFLKRIKKTKSFFAKFTFLLSNTQNNV